MSTLGVVLVAFGAGGLGVLIGAGIVASYVGSKIVDIIRGQNR